MSDCAISVSEKEICDLIDSTNSAGVIGFIFIVDKTDFNYLINLNNRSCYKCIFKSLSLPEQKTYWVLIIPDSIESYVALTLLMDSDEFSSDINGFIINADKNYDATANIRKFDLLLKLRHNNLITDNLPRILA